MLAGNGKDPTLVNAPGHGSCQELVQGVLQVFHAVWGFGGFGILILKARLDISKLCTPEGAFLDSVSQPEAKPLKKKYATP